jgi:hypothetical protein
LGVVPDAAEPLEPGVVFGDAGVLELRDPRPLQEGGVIGGLEGLAHRDPVGPGGNGLGSDHEYGRLQPLLKDVVFLILAGLLVGVIVFLLVIVRQPGAGNQAVWMREVEENVDRGLSATHMDRLPLEHGNERRQTLLPIQQELLGSEGRDGILNGKALRGLTAGRLPDQDAPAWVASIEGSSKSRTCLARQT